MLRQLFIVHQTELPLITVLHQEKDLILQLKSLNIELHTRKNIHPVSYTHLDVYKRQLLGGGTAMIGDPSGKTDMRKMMTKETIDHNIECFKKQMSKFIDFSDGKALMVNNADWLMDLNYIDVLREVGPHFSVNRMLTAECYKQRMERGLSFLEFNYICLVYTSTGCHKRQNIC